MVSSSLYYHSNLEAYEVIACPELMYVVFFSLFMVSRFAMSSASLRRSICAIAKAAAFVVMSC